MSPEIDHKHALIRAYLQTQGASALWLRRTRNIAWFTAGAEAGIPISSEMGAYSVLVTPDERFIYASNIEADRIREEEAFEAHGFTYRTFPWHAPQTPEADVSGLLLQDEGAVEEQLKAWRCVLTDWEQARYRELAHDTAIALENTARAIQPGQTEWDIAGMLDGACRARGGVAVVNLIGTDERIFRYRHPVPTGKRLEKFAMLVGCMRRGGLVAAASRLVYFGDVPGEISDRLQVVAGVDAAALSASREGATLGEVLSAMQAAYARAGMPEEWQKHHQGGLVAYLPRERLAVPESSFALQNGHVVGWNPSAPGAKCEDSALITPNGADILTHTGNWTYVTVTGWQRPAILSL